MSFFRMLPWAKIVTWVIFLGLVYTLRNLFAVFFITFVISYICRNVVKFFYSPFGDRWYVRKIIVIVTFAFLLTGFYLGGRFLVPNFAHQGSQVWGLAKDLQIHEGLDGAFAKLYASLRFKLYRNSDEYKGEFEEYKENADPELVFQTFKKDAERIRRDFRQEMVREAGDSAWEDFIQSPDYNSEFETWKDGQIEKEYQENKARLEAEAEQELKARYSDDGLKNLKERHGSTPDAWSEYLKADIIDTIIAGIDQEKKLTFVNQFRSNYIQQVGEAAVERIEGTPQWEERFKKYYERLPEEEREHEYDLFLRLEGAKNKQEYREFLGGKEEPEARLERIFADRKQEEFANTFKNYAFVKEMSQRTNEGFLPGVTKWVASTVEYIFTLAFHLILSVFLSFFIVWDIPKLKDLVRRLEHSRVKEFYREVYPGLVSLGWLLGRAFQAQAIIAMVNTALTLSALSLFDVPHRTFLCSIVFICSFIPVVGVIISSVPIVVVSLQQPGSVILALEMVGCILLIHFIETTVLNPKIMGDMLKVHPLMVLVILLVGEHFFGVWGLLLGVPVSVYIFRFVILRNTKAFLPEGVKGLISSTEQPAEPAVKF